MMMDRELQLRQILLTVDGKGKRVKERALEELLLDPAPAVECTVKPLNCIAGVNKEPKG